MLFHFWLTEFSLLSKRYNVLYQSLIPNYKLTVKILRRHFTIADQVEQYILTGDSRRLCCQRVMNVLLVHLDIVKDHHQFCDWLDSVSVMGSLIDKIETGDQHLNSLTPLLIIRYMYTLQLVLFYYFFIKH